MDRQTATQVLEDLDSACQIGDLPKETFDILRDLVYAALRREPPEDVGFDHVDTAPIVMQSETSLIVQVSNDHDEHLAKFTVRTARECRIDRFYFHAQGVTISPLRYGANTYRVHGQMRPWSTVEEIAKWVADDGRDAQRLALADGIRGGWPNPVTPSSDD